MANVNVGNLPDAVHQAIRIQAAHHGRSTEAEIRDILERAAKPEGRVKLGSVLASIAREAGGLTDEEVAFFESARIKSPSPRSEFLMILLDTNVISETLRQEPNARVLDWIDAQALETLYRSVIRVAELCVGIALMPAGKRRDSLHEYLEMRVLPMFANRVLTFDMACTKAYAELLATPRAAGLAVETADELMAAVALANGFAVATRDTTPFEAAGLNVINPWNARQ